MIATGDHRRLIASDGRVKPDPTPEGLAHALEGSDWPPAWKRDLDNPACIIVDPSVWPTPGLPDIEPGPAGS